MNKIRRLFNTPWRDLAVIAEAWLIFAWVDIILRYRPFQRWRGWLNTALNEQPNQTGNARMLAKTRRLIRLSEIAARHHWSNMNCLRRSLVQKRLLQRRHIAVSLSIGVCHQGEQFKAHAWLSQQGSILNDTSENIVQYTPMPLQNLPQLGLTE